MHEERCHQNSCLDTMIDMSCDHRYKHRRSQTIPSCVISHRTQLDGGLMVFQPHRQETNASMIFIRCRILCMFSVDGYFIYSDTGDKCLLVAMYICPRTSVAKLRRKDSVVTYLCMFCQQIPHHCLGIDSFKFVKSRNKVWLIRGNGSEWMVM